MSPVPAGFARGTGRQRGGKRGSLLEQKVLWANVPRQGRKKPLEAPRDGPVSMLTAEVVSAAPLPWSLPPWRRQVCVSAPLRPSLGFCRALAWTARAPLQVLLLTAPWGASRDSVPDQFTQKFGALVFLQLPQVTSVARVSNPCSRGCASRGPGRSCK